MGKPGDTEALDNGGELEPTLPGLVRKDEDAKSSAGPTLRYCGWRRETGRWCRNCAGYWTRKADQMECQKLCDRFPDCVAIRHSGTRCNLLETVAYNEAVYEPISAAGVQMTYINERNVLCKTSLEYRSATEPGSPPGTPRAYGQAITVTAPIRELRYCGWRREDGANAETCPHQGRLDVDTCQASCDACAACIAIRTDGENCDLKLSVEYKVASYEQARRGWMTRVNERDKLCHTSLGANLELSEPNVRDAYRNLLLETDATEVYKESEAIRFMHYAIVSFCDLDRISSWSCGPHCDAVAAPPMGRVLPIGEGLKWKVHGYIADLDLDSGGKCIAAFRGSSNKRNWEADVRAYPEPWPPGGAAWCPGCEAHSGFAGAYQELRDQLAGAVKLLECKEVRLLGHSLGAAVASLAALDLRATQGVETPTAYLYGAPRVGNMQFARVFDGEVGFAAPVPSAWRIVNGFDIIPRLKVYSYVHTGLEVYYATKNTDRYRLCAELEDPDPGCSLSTNMGFNFANLDHVTYLNMSTLGSKMSKLCKPSTGPMWR